MSETATQAPVIWKTTQAVADRLLGAAGHPLLDRMLNLSQTISAERRWPLSRIMVVPYLDPESDLGYLLIALEFDCGLVRAERLWDAYQKAVEDMRQELDDTKRRIFDEMIHYEVRSNPQTTAETPKIPIAWKVNNTTTNRLLGAIGRSLLYEWLEHTKQLASERQWPLQRIKVEYYQDEEITDWEYVILTMDYDCPSDKAGKLFWKDYLEEVFETRQKKLTGPEKEIFLKKIDHDFESNP